MTIYKTPIDNLPTLPYDFYQMFIYQMTILPNDYYYCVEGIEMRQLGCKVRRLLFLKH